MVHTCIILGAIGLFPLLTAGSKSPFSYESGASNGPENWGSLTVYANNECNGDRNSPIAITTDDCTSYADYIFTAGNCESGEVEYELSDHNVEVVVPSQCFTMSVPGVDNTFEAEQFHIHTYSEHTIDSDHFAAELHIVHVDASNASSYAVVGMMITPDNPYEHELFEVFLAGWESAAQETTAICNATQARKKTIAKLVGTKSLLRRRLQTVEANIYDLIPEDSSFYMYSGGLTTPPCSQIVLWNVADTPIEISESQYKRLVELILGYVDPSTCRLATVASKSGSTSRPPVALNGRTVTRVCPASMEP